MKKLFVALISAVLCFSLFVFVGCNSEPQLPDGIIDVETLQPGDVVPCYPSCAFDYKYEVSDDETHIFHISEISISFVKKHTITDSVELTESFRLYEMLASAHGYTEQELAGHRFTIEVYGANTSYLFECTISDNGEFFGEKTVTHNVRYLSGISFGRIAGLR